MKIALLFGSTGLVGSNVLKQLIDNSIYSKIKIFVRSEIELKSNKLQIIKTDFSNLEYFKEHIKGDDCFFCIGTTKKNSPNQDEYKRIEFDIPKQVAQLAKLNDVKSFIFVISSEVKLLNPLANSFRFLSNILI